MDSQCTSGKDGRCVYAGGGVPYCACTYDTCMGDADCKTGTTCGCHGTAYAGDQGNTCVPGDCRVDTDCGPGGYCSPTLNVNSCGSLGGYYCHTTADQCLDDADCSSSQNGPQVCAWSAAAKRWQCQPMPLCG